MCCAQRVETRSLVRVAGAMRSRNPCALRNCVSGAWPGLVQAQENGLAMAFSLHGLPSAIATQNACCKRHVECMQQPLCEMHKGMHGAMHTAKDAEMHAAMMMHSYLHVHDGML
eukprot:1142942-Pelagomonas_calceolata.AAC.3